MRLVSYAVYPVLGQDFIASLSKSDPLGQGCSGQHPIGNLRSYATGSQEKKQDSHGRNGDQRNIHSKCLCQQCTWQHGTHRERDKSEHAACTVLIQQHSAKLGPGHADCLQHGEFPPAQHHWSQCAVYHVQKADQKYDSA